MSKLKLEQYVSPWGDAQLCPCDSGIAFYKCCKTAPGRPPIKKVPDLSPRGYPTGYVNPKCFMKASANCSAEMSGEHYISESILKQFSSVAVAGMPWQEPGAYKPIGIGSLKAHVLCKRHNSALSHLDQFASDAFRKIGDAISYAGAGKHPGSPRYYLVSGDGMELWAIKALAGIFEAGIATLSARRLRDSGSIDYGRIAGILGGGVDLGTSGGLFLIQKEGAVDHSKLEIAPIVLNNMQAVGIRIHFGVLHFDVITIPYPSDVGLQRLTLQSRHRPDLIDFHGSQRESRVVLSWDRRKTAIKRFGIVIEPG